MSTDRLLSEYNVEFQYHGFPLRPGIPAEGMKLEKLFQGRDVNIEQSQSDIARRMDEAGLPFEKYDRAYNTRLAQELAKWAEEKPESRQLRRALYEAFFVHHENIGEVDVLLKVVEDCGLPVDEARDVLETRSFRAVVAHDWAKAQVIGVTGVPSFVIGERAVVGFNPYDRLETLIKMAGAEKRSPSDDEDASEQR